MKKKLSIVGGGPGDPELITIKAWRRLREADVILYDALANNELLKGIPSSVVTIPVGKRCGHHSLSQPEINDLIIQCINDYGHVVRLKGGDPMIFGRSNEEIDYVREHGFETEVIPGVSSAIAVPGQAGIPMTCRGVAESAWILTGTTKNHIVSKDIALAAQSTATMIILMATRKLEDIIAIVSAYKAIETPVALIQNGTLPNQKVVLGALENICHRATSSDFSSPGIIVIGEVVYESPAYLETLIEEVLSNS